MKQQEISIHEIHDNFAKLKTDYIIVHDFFTGFLLRLLIVKTISCLFLLWKNCFLISSLDLKLALRYSEMSLLILFKKYRNNIYF